MVPVPLLHPFSDLNCGGGAGGKGDDAVSPGAVSPGAIAELIICSISCVV